MKIATRFKLVATLAVLTVALAFFYGMPNGHTPSLDDSTGDQEVFLEVAFEEDRSNPAITVQLSDTPPIPVEAGFTGYWSATIKVPTGTRVILSVSQHSGGTTECHVQARSVGKSQQMTGPGTISCQVVAK